ncbi:MAG TPA: hypothetical protein VFE45_05760 [Coriobacteriia bacterium]|nr:hypothetical protein [Coriobacteriia bacterium]
MFRKEVANYYTPVMPVYVVDDLPEERAFLIALDEAFRFMGDLHDLPEPQRAYARRLAKQRLHQPAFRTRVLLAYDTRRFLLRQPFRFSRVKPLNEVQNHREDVVDATLRADDRGLTNGVRDPSREHHISVRAHRATSRRRMPTIGPTGAARTAGPG